MMLRLPLSLLLALASSQAFSTPSFVGRSSVPLAVGKGILEMAEVDASIVFPATTKEEPSFLGNYEDLVVPGKEGHGYQLLLEDDDERFHPYVVVKQQPSSRHEAAQQRARANMGYFANRDLVGHVPETKSVTRSNIQMRPDTIDYFSSHAVGTTIIPDHTADARPAQKMARDHLDFFSTPSMMMMDLPSNARDATEARARARDNIDFFTLKETIGHGYASFFNKMDQARNVARNNIDFFSDTAKSSPEKKKKANDNENKERTAARLNIGYFS